jgi:hypothetical protein
MANDDHIAQLMKGVDAWNAWRDENPDILPDLSEANLSGANLGRADLIGADFAGANLKGANLSGAVLQAATLVNTDLTGADLTGCRIYGVSAWALKLEGTKQQNLIITPRDEPEIRVDDLEVAQFIYLLLDREKIRNVIDTVTRRGVLLLGRFGDGGLALLQTIAAFVNGAPRSEVNT